MSNDYQRFADTLTKASAAGQPGPAYPINATGRYLYVREANHDFNVQIEGGQTLQVRKGTVLDYQQLARRWTLTAIDANENTTFEVFISTAPIDFKDRTVLIPQTRAVGSATVSLTSGSTATITGQVNTNGLLWRKAIILSDRTGGGGGYLEVQDSNANVMCYLDNLQTITIETSDTIKIKAISGNQTVGIGEIYYLA